MSQTLLTWSEFVSVLGNERETHDFQSIDIGFGNLLVAILQGAQVSSQSKQYEPFLAFLNRSPADQVKKSPYQDPKAFLRALRASAKGRSEEAEAIKAETGVKLPTINLAALPVVFFNRRLGFLPADGDRYVPVRQIADMGMIDESGNETLGAIVHQHHLVLTYQVYLLAWDEITLSRLATLYASYFRLHVRTFNFQARIFGNPLDGTADILTTAIPWDDLSPDVESDRLLCLSASIEVITPVYEGVYAGEREITYNLLELAPMFDAGV